MPTDEEMSELRTKCTWEWISQNGVKGHKVIGPNGNSIFLPAAGYIDGGNLNDVGSYGYYWSSSLYSNYPADAYNMYFGSGYKSRGTDFDRYYGLSVRPVCQ